jgi:hypothetical protein
MFRILGILILLAALVAGGLWFSAQSLPSWYDDSVDQQTSAAEQLNQEISRSGAGNFLGGKLADVLSGRLRLNDAEFNALFLASLQADKDGRKLLAVSDAVNANITENGIELAAVINLDKVEKIDANARRGVEKANRMFPFLNDSRVAVAIIGTPIARNGRLGIKDDFSLRVGAIPISNSSLRQLGADVERANRESLDLKYLSVNSVTLRNGEIELGVTPSF